MWGHGQGRDALLPLHPLSPTGSRRSSPKVIKAGKLTLALTYCSIRESKPCLDSTIDLTLVAAGLWVSQVQGHEIRELAWMEQLRQGKRAHPSGVGAGELPAHVPLRPLSWLISISTVDELPECMKELVLHRPTTGYLRGYPMRFQY